jgi:thiol-disulfide isomerase/thioredoxin
MRPGAHIAAGRGPLLLLLPLALASVVACAGSGPQLRARARTAAEAGRPLLIEFYADWCAVCRRFDQTVYPDSRVQAALRQVQFVRLDAERGGREEAKRLGIVGYPSFVFINGRGAPVMASRGLPTVEYFVEFIEWGQVYALDEAAIDARLQQSRDRSALLLAARWAANQGNRDRALALYDEVEALCGGDAAIGWERVNVGSARGSRVRWAQAATAYLRRHPRSDWAVDALRVVVLSGGLSRDAAIGAVEAFVEAIAGDAALLDDVVYVLIAGRYFATALQLAERLVEQHPRMPLFRTTLQDAVHRRAASRRARQHTTWLRREASRWRIQ